MLSEIEDCLACSVILLCFSSRFEFAAVYVDMS